MTSAKIAAQLPKTYSALNSAEPGPNTNTPTAIAANGNASLRQSRATTNVGGVAFRRWTQTSVHCCHCAGGYCQCTQGLHSRAVSARSKLRLVTYMTGR